MSLIDSLSLFQLWQGVHNKHYKNFSNKCSSLSSNFLKNLFFKYNTTSFKNLNYLKHKNFVLYSILFLKNKKIKKFKSFKRIFTTSCFTFSSLSIKPLNTFFKVNRPYKLNCIYISNFYLFITRNMFILSHLNKKQVNSKKKNVFSYSNFKQSNYISLHYFNINLIWAKSIYKPKLNCFLDISSFFLFFFFSFFCLNFEFIMSFLPLFQTIYSFAPHLTYISVDFYNHFFKTTHLVGLYSFFKFLNLNSVRFVDRLKTKNYWFSWNNRSGYALKPKLDFYNGTFFFSCFFNLLQYTNTHFKKIKKKLFLNFLFNYTSTTNFKFNKKLLSKKFIFEFVVTDSLGNKRNVSKEYANKYITDYSYSHIQVFNFFYSHAKLRHKQGRYSFPYSLWYFQNTVFKPKTLFFLNNWWYKSNLLVSKNLNIKSNYLRFKSKLLTNTFIKKNLNNKKTNIKQLKKKIYFFMKYFYTSKNFLRFSLAKKINWDLKDPKSFNLSYYLKNYIKHTWCFTLTFYFKRSFFNFFLIFFYFYIFKLQNFSKFINLKLYKIYNNFKFNQIFLPKYFVLYKEINFRIKHTTILKHNLNSTVNMKLSFLQRYVSSALKLMYKHT